MYKIVMFEWQEGNSQGLPKGRVSFSIIPEDWKQERIVAFGKRSTPKGYPFWIKDRDILPMSREGRDDWPMPIGLGDPDGIGEAEI